MLKTDIASLDQLLAPIAEDLRRMEELIDNTIESSEELTDQVVSHVKFFRGKRLRPALVLLSGHCLQPNPKARENLIHLAAITELIHTCTLIHDDIIDEASSRRNSETFNHKWNNSVAVIFGDYLFSKAFFMSVNFEDAAVRRRLAEVISDLCEGEMMQLHGKTLGTVDEEFYYQMILLKTATFLGCCTGMGLKLAGGDGSLVEKMDKAGELLGSAFQIVDDCLDLVGSEGTMGKSLGTDIATGKFTLPLIKFFDEIPANEKASLVALFKAGEGRKVKEKIVTLLPTTSAIESSWQEARRFTEEAIEIFQSLPESAGQRSLIQLSNYLINRSH